MKPIFKFHLPQISPTSTRPRHTLALAALAVSLHFPVAHAFDYTVTPLLPLAGDNNVAIDDADTALTAIGYSRYVSTTKTTYDRAIVWNAGTASSSLINCPGSGSTSTIISSKARAVVCRISGINSQGTIAGYSFAYNGLIPSNSTLLLWPSSSASPINLGADLTKAGLNGFGSAYGINDLGWVFGESSSFFIWRAGKITKLAYPDPSAYANNGLAQGLGNDGTAAGQVVDLSNYDSHGIIWHPDGSFEILPDFLPRTVQSDGRVIGTLGGLPAVWQNGNISTYPGVVVGDSVASINSNGDAVGSTYQYVLSQRKSQASAVVWKNGQRNLLQNLAPAPAGFTFAYGVKILDDGSIYTLMSNSAGVVQGALLTPIGLH